MNDLGFLGVVSLCVCGYVIFVTAKTGLYLLFPSVEVFWPSWRIDFEKKKKAKRQEFMDRIDKVITETRYLSDDEEFRRIVGVDEEGRWIR